MHPSRVENGFYCTPLEPGYSVEITDAAIREFDFNRGTFWQTPKGEEIKKTMILGL